MMCQASRVRRLRLEINGKNLFKYLKVCKSETQLDSTQSVPKKKEKPRVLIVKSAFLRRISPTFLASGLVQDGNLQMSSGLDNGIFFEII